MLAFEGEREEGDSVRSVQELVEGEPYTRDEIHGVLGGDTQQSYLPWKGGRVTCAILTRDRNLAPPDVILVGGTSENVVKRSEVLCGQGGSIPVFVTEHEASHTYRGRYEVSHWSEDPRTLPLWNAAASREDVARVIFLRKVPDPKDL